jgi:hypothetical protein
VAEELTVAVPHAVEAEIDGDPVGPHRVMTARVLPAALVVRSG